MKIKIQPILGIAFINFVFLLIILIVFFSFFATPVGLEIRLPDARQGNEFEQGHVTVRITGENVLYFNGRVATVSDLKRSLLKINPLNTVIYLRVDRRASMGRVTDVWEMCKGLGVARVKIVTAQDE